MNLLYPDEKDVKYSVHLQERNEKVLITFSCDGGKFGTDEFLDEYELTPTELWTLLRNK